MLMGINGVLFIQKDGFGGFNLGDKHAENHLTGGWPTPLKNMSLSVGMIIPNIWKNKKCIKMFQTTNQ